MKNIFDLNIFESISPDDMTLAVDYVEFTECLESLDELLSKVIFTEAAVGQNQGIKKGLQNAVKTTKDVAGVYNDATDAGGSINDAIFQLLVNTASLIAKILKFILTNLAKIPLALAKAIKYLTNVPQTVIAKIRGDLEIYITVDDLSLLYDSIIPNMADFLTLATSFTKAGDYNTSMNIPFIDTAHDFKTYKAMDKIYKKIANVRFEKSVVKMNDKQIIETYLSPKSKYYKFLEDTLHLLNKGKPEFEELVKAATNKFNANEIKGVVSKLSPENQLRAKNSPHMISKVVSIMGNIVKYIIIDLSTINKAVFKLQTSSKKLKLGQDGAEMIDNIDNKN